MLPVVVHALVHADDRIQADCFLGLGKEDVFFVAPLDTRFGGKLLGGDSGGNLRHLLHLLLGLAFGRDRHGVHMDEKLWIGLLTLLRGCIRHHKVAFRGARLLHQVDGL